MRFEEHCERSERLIGDRFEQVHIWLDHFAYMPSTPTSDAYYDPTHRQYRHNMQGIIEVGKMWGPEAESAAAVHVLDDLYPDGWTLGQAYSIPLATIDGGFQ